MTESMRSELEAVRDAAAQVEPPEDYPAGSAPLADPQDRDRVALAVLGECAHPAGGVCDSCADALPGDEWDPDPPRWRIWIPDELRNRPRPPELIEGILTARGFAVLAGPSGDGKTFLALDWAASIATGRLWHGHTTTPGHVLYIAAEGLNPERLTAWETTREPIGDRLGIIIETINLHSGEDAEALARHVAASGIVLVVVDTLARSMVGGDENTARDVGLVVGAPDQVRAAGAAVLVIHHTGHDKTRERGSTSLRAAADDLFLMRRIGGGGVLQLTVEKRREGVVADPKQFRLRGVDGTGSVVLTPSASTTQVQGQNLTENEARALGVVQHRVGPEGARFTDWMDLTGLAREYAVLIQVSRELLEDTGVDLGGYLARQTGRALGNASGTDFVVGDGTAKPRGVVTASTAGLTGGTGQTGQPTADEVIDLFHSVIPEYRGRGYWFMSDTTWSRIRKLKDTTNNYLVGPIAEAGAPQLLGRPVVLDTNVADSALNAKSVLFGDFSAYYIRDARGVRFERSDDFAFANDLVTFRAILRTDGDLVDETGAIKHYLGAAS